MEKICRKCFKSKPIEEFIKAKVNKDGYNNFCKFCNNETTKKWQKANRDKVNKYSRTNYHKTKEDKQFKSNCRRKTYKILKRRKIEFYQKDCFICGDIAQEIHHNDYTNPFDIYFLCRKCHKHIHVLMNKGYEFSKLKNDE